MRKAKKFARRSAPKATGRLAVTSKSAAEGIQNGTYKAIACRCSMGTARFRPLIHTHTQVGKWDLIIAHPPCTDLAVSGARWFPEKQKDFRQQKACVFFMYFALAHCDRIAVENPVGIMSTVYRKPDQIINPWQFGHPESKKTCLWLKGIPKLEPTNVLDLPESGVWQNQTKDGQNKLIVDGRWIAFNDPRTAKERSKTYPGIAKAMAEQWGSIDLHKEGDENGNRGE